MDLAQRLMGNLPNRDENAARELAGKLGVAWDGNGYGPFVPEALKSDLRVFGHR
jgi:hypothetical protein